MWAQPDDPDVAERMRAAHRQARTALGVLADQSAFEAWGWRGRTLSQAVVAPDGPAWLRVACAPTGHIARTFWDGSLEAEKAIPGSVPRPRLRAGHDWTHDPWEYRAELYDRVAAHPGATSPALLTEPDLPSTWWAALRTALEDIATVPTYRFTVRQQYLDRAMPHFLGAPIDTAPPSWSTAHGDFHYGNLCTPPCTSSTGRVGAWPPAATTPPYCTATACWSPASPPGYAASSHFSSTPPQADLPSWSPSPNSSTAPPAAKTSNWPNHCATAPPCFWAARFPSTSKIEVRHDAGPPVARAGLGAHRAEASVWAWPEQPTSAVPERSISCGQ
ncbi:MAG: hypothetical protein ACRDQ4_19615 [Pseudonocardiaceae bacterium]